MVAFSVPYAEIQICSTCVLHCDGCAVFANYNLKPYMDVAEGVEMIRTWGERITPKEFRVLGGEPLLHPDLEQFIRAAAETWPNAKRSMVTNGLLAEKRGDIVSVLVETKTALQCSFHSNDPSYLERMRPALAVLKGWAQQSIDISILDHRQFFRFYRGIGKNMRPYQDNDPEASWSTCFGKDCLNLRHRRLWKCGVPPFLRDVLTKFDLLESEEWKPYLGYEGIGIDCSDEVLEEFIGRKAEMICGMCPKNKTPYYKDVNNTDYELMSERVETSFPPIPLREFVEKA